MSLRPPSDEASHRLALLASGGILLGGALWGIFWIPVRLLNSAGLDGPWPGLLIYLISSALVLPFAVWRWRRMRRYFWPLCVAGLLTGAAFSLYATSIVMTDVVRAILLFYLTPIWGTALGTLFLNERLTPYRIGAVAAAIAGLVAVVGLGGGRPVNTGDVLALLSGGFWAFGTLQVYRMGVVPSADLVIAFVLGSLVVTVGIIAVAGDALGPVPDAATLIGGIGPGLAVAFYVLPMLWLTIWPATVLTPGRIGLLLMSDAAVGVLSAALFAGEPYGLREGLGTVLIIGAAAIEILGHRKP